MEGGGRSGCACSCRPSQGVRDRDTVPAQVRQLSIYIQMNREKATRLRERANKKHGCRGRGAVRVTRARRGGGGGGGEAAPPPPPEAAHVLGGGRVGPQHVVHHPVLPRAPQRALHLPTQAARTRARTPQRTGDARPRRRYPSRPGRGGGKQVGGGGGGCRCVPGFFGPEEYAAAAAGRETASGAPNPQHRTPPPSPPPPSARQAAWRMSSRVAPASHSSWGMPPCTQKTAPSMVAASGSVSK